MHNVHRTFVVQSYNTDTKMHQVMGIGKLRNELVRGESGWSLFAEREVKCIVDWLFRIGYEESLPHNTLEGSCGIMNQNQPGI